MPLIELRENQEEIQTITDDAVQLMGRRFGFEFENGVNAIPTITYAFVSGAIQYLGSKKVEGGSVQVNLFDLIELGISHDSVEAEKEGNYVPYVNVGEVAKNFVDKADKEPTEIFTFEETDEIKEITDIAASILKSDFDIGLAKHNHVIPMIAYSFLTTAVGYLFSNRCENGTVEINVMQLFDIGFTHVEDEDRYQLFCVAGQAMKLQVKDDDVTETEE